jgi:hypothetical protein
MALPGPSSKRRAGKTGKRGGGQHQAPLLFLVLPPCHGPPAGIGNPYGHSGVLVQRSPRRAQSFVKARGFMKSMKSLSLAAEAAPMRELATIDGKPANPSI